MVWKTVLYMAMIVMAVFAINGSPDSRYGAHGIRTGICDEGEEELTYCRGKKLHLNGLQFYSDRKKKYLI